MNGPSARYEGRRRMRCGPWAAFVFAAAMALTGCGDGDETARGAGDARAVIAELDAEGIARRVEALRGLRYERVPGIAAVGPEQLPAALTAGRRAPSPEELEDARLASEAQVVLLQLQGALPADFDLKRAAEAGGDALLGFYDPRGNRLRMVAGELATDRERLEPVAAHELTHALQDQALGLDAEPRAPGDPDAQAAYRALVEGDATVVEDAYAKRYGLAAPDRLDERARGGRTARLPSALAFEGAAPYVLGKRFVRALLDEAGSYRLVDRALRSRPPRTMAEVADPERYLAGRRPARVRLVVTPPAGFDRITSRTWGFNDAVMLLLTREGQAREAIELAAGWDGGRVELWRRGRSGCSGTCKDAALAVVASSWRSTTAAEGYAAAVSERLLDRGAELDAGGFSLDGAGAAIATDGRTVTLAWAPTTDEALDLAERSQR